MFKAKFFLFPLSDFSVIFLHAIFRVRKSSYFKCFNAILSYPSTKFNFTNLGLLIFIDVFVILYTMLFFLYIEQLCFIQTQIIKAVFTPTLLYQSENWTLTSKERQMLTTTEMRCLRKAAGKTRMDKIRNEESRRRVNMQPAEQTANKNKIRRMAPTAPQIQALMIQPEGRRPRGRP